MYEDHSGLTSRDTLERNYKNAGSRLPVNPIPKQAKEVKEPNRALKETKKEKE